MTTKLPREIGYARGLLMRKIAVPFQAKACFASSVEINQDIILLAHSEESALKLVNQVKFFSDKEVLYFPSFDSIPYDVSSPCSSILSQRAKVLASIALSISKNPKILVTNSINLITKIPPQEVFFDNTLIINKSTKISINRITNFLVDNGFIRSASAIDSGEFAIKGEIVDIALSKDKNYRIVFNWNKIESIKMYDPLTQLSNGSVDEIIVNPASEVIFNEKTLSNFKNNYLKNFGPQRTNIPMYDAILEKRKFPGHESLLPLFYERLYTLLDYLDNPVIIYDNLSMQNILEHQSSFSDFYNARQNANKLYKDNFYPALDSKLFILDINETNKILNDENNFLISQEGTLQNDIKIISKIDSLETIDRLKSSNPNKALTICASAKHGLESIKNLLKIRNYDFKVIDNLKAAASSTINLAQDINLDSTFETDKFIFIPQQDLIASKEPLKKTTSSQTRLKNILAELETLKENEIIVHKDHGIGKFLGVETVTAGGQPHDCLKILYAENAKLYVPVENIDSVKKYGDFEVELDRLGSVSWQKRKGKLKERIGEIAHKLIETTAKRKIASVEPIDFNSDDYDKFCQKFPYVETDDQLRAIEEVKVDLTSGIIMDRLICGDVGFGKTEVALRAAYMVANDNISQVAIIVPTTILCKQHYKRFCERFDGFDLNIVSLSRLSSPKEIKKIKEDIKSGDANIIIGTHALLSKNLEFNTLKLLIIDEEQHFGVSQKETLKELKPGVHVLSLSATPIPRTLQMSMVGLKDLSLIAQAPVDRLAIRTNIMPFDEVIVRDALLKEHARGGKSFYVAPRISDISDIEKRLKALVPELKYKIVHGKMSPISIDQTMQEFDDGKFDVLISTSIIESGIDIPTANTMIIHKSDQFGLAQSYQLRGRIGRGKTRGYVYFTLEKKATTKNAIKRLEVLQTIDSLGAGFTIASHDMDFRGFGNLVGEEQSGHVKEVGVELYQDMLDEQINLLSNQKQDISFEEKGPVSINLGLPVFIPKEYIKDSSLRLGIYKRIGNIENLEEIVSFREEMIDRFGSIPAELNNLLDIVKIKHICRKANIMSLDAAEKGFIIKFYPNSNAGESVIKFIKKFPHQAKLKPGDKLAFIKNIDKTLVIEETFKLLKELTA